MSQPAAAWNNAVLCTEYCPQYKAQHVQSKDVKALKLYGFVALGDCRKILFGW
jgi:hypothetical protein